MKLVLSILSLSLVALSAHAADNTLVCSASDSTFSYQNAYILTPNQHVQAVFSMGTEEALNKVCWGNGTYEESAEKISIKGKVECVDGTGSDFTDVIDLAKMEAPGHWQGTMPCRWMR